MNAINEAVANNKNIMLTGEPGSGKLHYAREACVESNKKHIIVYFSCFDFDFQPGLDDLVNRAKEENSVFIFDIDDILLYGVKSTFILKCMAHCQCIITKRLTNEFVLPLTIVDRIDEFFTLPLI